MQQTGDWSETPFLWSEGGYLPGRYPLDKRGWSQAADLVGTAAVVVSLVYVGLQVRQNTAAIQTSTSQEVYQQNQEQGLLIMESAEFADILVRAQLGQELPPVDSIRYDRYLNLVLNTHEAVYTNALQGTMEPEMAAAWLDGIGTLTCMTGMEEYWAEGRGGYHDAFRGAMDSAFVATRCPP